MQFLIYIVLCLPFCFAIDCHKENVTDDGYICQSPNYPNDYPAGICECNFQVNPGYKIEVFIESLDLDSAENGDSEGDNIVITGGPDDKQIKFAWFLNTTQKYLFENNKVSLKFDAKKKSVGATGFSIHFRRYGGDLTTIAPITEIPWPTPSDEDKIYHSIFLKMSPKEFKANESDFINLMVDISSVYCKNKKFKLVENITTRNIIMKSISNCPISWPNTEKCVEIQYALPIILENKDYELTRISLDEMWINYGKDEFDNVGWMAYEVPDMQTSFMWWIVLCCIILVGFGVFLYGLKVLSSKMNFSGKRRRSDTEPITSNLQKTSYTSSRLTHSEVPPIFGEPETRALDNTLPYFEHDNYQQYAVRPQQQLPRNFTEDSSDDDILDIARENCHSNSKSLILNQAAPDGHPKESTL